jgi:FHA domain
MATLEEVKSGRRFLLIARSVVGRLQTCHVQVPSNNVSALHAQIIWDGSVWQVQDLSSRNGTFVDGRRVVAGEQAPLVCDTTLAFGAAENVFRFVDASPPVLMATADGEVVVAHGDVLCLPADDACEVTVYRDGERRWIVASDQGERALEDQAVISAGKRAWRIGLPGLTARTDEAPGEPTATVLDTCLTLAVSRDGEHLSARVEQQGKMILLESRAHLFLLLELARTRLSDAAQPQLAPSEHGWMYRDELQSALGIDEANLNIWVYRARQQFIKRKVLGAGALFERREGTHQLRIGIAKLCIS